jgi:hypothetical protein
VQPLPQLGAADLKSLVALGQADPPPIPQPAEPLPPDQPQ